MAERIARARILAAEAGDDPDEPEEYSNKKEEMEDTAAMEDVGHSRKIRLGVDHPASVIKVSIRQ